MKRHAAKRRPKHIRRILARLTAAGITEVRVEIGRGYLLTFDVGGVPMRVASCKAPAGDSVERLWGNIRALFRSRGIEVPA